MVEEGKDIFVEKIINGGAFASNQKRIPVRKVA